MSTLARLHPALVPTYGSLLWLPVGGRTRLLTVNQPLHSPLLHFCNCTWPLELVSQLNQCQNVRTICWPAPTVGRFMVGETRRLDCSFGYAPRDIAVPAHAVLPL